MLNWRPIVIGVSFIFLPWNSAHADIKVRGFADVIGSNTNTSLPLTWINNYGKQFVFDSSRVGLNVSAELSHEWDFAGQLVARGDTSPGKQGSYLVTADWIFFTYRPNDHWRFRVGRQIFPLYLYSEEFDVGFNYLWIHLPTTVYGIVPVKSFNGLSVAYSEDFGDYRGILSVFAGTGFFEQFSSGIGGAVIRDQYVRGASLVVNDENIKVSASYKISHPVGNIYQSNGGSELTIPFDIGNVQNWSLGVSTHLNSFLFIAEGGTSHTDIPNTDEDKGFYATLGYELLNATLMPNVTYAYQWTKNATVFYPDSAVFASDPTGALQKSLSQLIVGINYRANLSTILKLSYERDELAYRNSSLNFGADTFSLAVDAIF